MSNKKSKIYLSQQNEIKQKLHDRDYVLGLDLGVGSIGAAIIALNPTEKTTYIPSDIVFSCSRIFKASDGAADRRSHRLIRNSIRHKRNRLELLWKLLSEKELMLPFSCEEAEDPSVLMFSKKVRKENPYVLRFKGLSDKLELDEIGYAIYHMSNHRGSSSVFGEDDTELKENEKSNYAEAKNLTSSLLNTNPGFCFIELLFKDCKDSNHFTFRNTYKEGKKNVAPLPTRDLIEKELNKFLEKQKSFYPEIFDDHYIQKIKQVVLYENDMVVPEAGFCPYFPNEQKLPKIALINEERRIWEALNNVRFSLVKTDENGRIVSIPNQHLSETNKKACFDILYSGKNLTSSELKKVFPNTVQIEDVVLQGTTKKDQKIEGYKYCRIRDNKLFSGLSEDIQVELLTCYQNSISENSFIQKTKSITGFTENQIVSIIPDLPKKAAGQYAPCGLSAMKIILPYIQALELSFQEAVKIAIENGQLKDNSILRNQNFLPYYGQAIPNSMQSLMGKAWHSSFSTIVDTNRFIKPNTNKDEEMFGKIANPVVHQTLNELRKLVNELIDILERKPKYIRIETAKDLKVGQEKREQLSRENNQRQKNNKNLYDKYCLPHSLKYDKVKTFRIWEEQGMICPYCLKPISVFDIVNGNADLDHIFPREDVPGNPENNLVVAHKRCNEIIKGKRIPYDAFAHDTELWNRILQNADENLPTKKWRFEKTSEEYADWLKNSGMISRFKTDNSYIATIAREYLSVLFSEEDLRHCHVDTVRGSETAILRKAWHLQDITNELAQLHDSDSQDLAVKNRIDVRHHALDAIIIAYSTKGLIKQINTLSAQSIPLDSIQEKIKVPVFFKVDGTENESFSTFNFMSTVRNELLNRTFISRKIDHADNGQLLKETSYSLYAQNGDSVIYGTKKKVKNLNYKDKMDLSKMVFENYQIPTWVKPKENQKIDILLKTNKDALDRIKSCYEKAKISLMEENSQLKAIGKKERNISEALIWNRTFKEAGGYYYQINNGSLSKLFMTRNPKDEIVGNLFDTGDNYCIEVYKDNNGQVCGEVVRKIDKLNRDFTPKYVKYNYEHIISIHPYDILEIDQSIDKTNLSGADKVSSITIPNAKQGKSFICVTTFTTLQNGNIQVYFDSISSGQPQQTASLYLSSSMLKKKPRLVVLSSAGLVKYVSKTIGE